MIQLLDIPINEDTEPEDLERFRRNLVDVIRELQRLPLAGAKVIKDVTLYDGVAVPVAHRCGRPVVVLTSPPRGAVTTGRIEEVRSGSHDRAQYAVLKASDWGASITVDVVVL